MAGGETQNHSNTLEKTWARLSALARDIRIRENGYKREIIGIMGLLIKILPVCYVLEKGFFLVQKDVAGR